MQKAQILPQIKVVHKDVHKNAQKFKKSLKTTELRVEDNLRWYYDGQG